MNWIRIRPLAITMAAVGLPALTLLAASVALAYAYPTQVQEADWQNRSSSGKAGLDAPVAPMLTDTPTPVGGIYDPVWYTVDGGGGMFSTDGTFSVGGSVGQPDAGTHTDGIYTVDGGFWSATIVTHTPTSTRTRTPTRTPNNTRTPTPTPTVALLVGHVTWQGPPPQPSALQRLPITLTLKSGSTEVNYPSQTTDASGIFTVTVTGLANGTYDWRVKGAKWLANSGVVVLAGAPQTDAEMGLMRAGDCNDDNIVSIGDFNILKQTFGRSLGDPGYDARADFNNDDVVSIVDFNLMKGNFGVSGSPPLRMGKP